MDKEFSLTAKVRKIVVDTISFRVKAEDLNKALQKLDYVMESYPKAHSIPGVSGGYVETRETYDPQILLIEEDKYMDSHING